MRLTRIDLLLDCLLRRIAVSKLAPIVTESPQLQQSPVHLQARTWSGKRDWSYYYARLFRFKKKIKKKSI